MLKFIVITVVCIVSLIVGLGSYKQYDNLSQEDEKKILFNVEDVIYEENTIDEDYIKDNITSEKTLLSNVTDNIKEEKQIKTNKPSSKGEIKPNSNKDKNIKEAMENNNSIVENKINKKVIEEEYQQDKVKETTESKIENTNEEINEDTIVQEIKYEYVYNYSETQRLKNNIEEIAKSNLDLFDEEGNKLYRVSEFSSKEQAMNRTNYFSPYNILEVKGVVLNTYSCTFLVYAIDYKINGILQQTRYYIKVSEF